MSATIINLIIQLIAGAVGGNVAGSNLKDYNLGQIGNTIAGALGGVGGGQLLAALLPALAGTAECGYWLYSRTSRRRRRCRCNRHHRRWSNQECDGRPASEVTTDIGNLGTMALSRRGPLSRLPRCCSSPTGSDR
jgi:uncharacterized membrane protein YeaQ/YmgE (transglycosylase-associated protein family)